MSQDVLVQIETLESEAAASLGEHKIRLLGEAILLADQTEINPQETCRLYMNAAEVDPDDPALFWTVGRSIKNPEVKRAISEALAGQAGDSLDHGWGVHRLYFDHIQIAEDRRIDSSLRDIVKQNPDLHPWQAYRFVEQNKWRNVQQVFTEQVGGDPSSARVEGARLTAHFASKLGADSAQLAEIWRQVYQSDRDDEEAQEALVPLYADLEKWKEYAEVYRRVINRLDEDQEEEKRTGLEALIDVYQSHLKSDQVLTELYAQLFELDPTRDEIADELEDKYVKLRKWPNILEMLQTRSDFLEAAEQRGDITARSRRLELSLRRADVLLTQLRKVDEAQELYEEIVAEDPSLTPALEALGQLFEKKREWTRWAEVRLQLAENLGDQFEAATQLRADAIQAEKKLRQPELALVFWERALECEDEPVALLALAELISNSSDWRRLDELVSRIEVHPDVDTSDRLVWLQRGGTAALDGLEDHERALELWMKVVEFDPDNKRTIDQIKKLLVEQSNWDELSRFLGSRGDWADLVKTLEGQANASSDPEEQVSLYFRSAEIWEHELTQADKAQRSLERILQIDSVNLKAATQLTKIYRDAEQKPKLASALEVVLSYSEEFDGDAEDRSILITELIDLYENDLRKPQQAFDWCAQLVVATPSSPEVWSTTLRLAGAVRPSQFETAIDLLSQARSAAAGLLEPQDERDLCLEIARVSKEELNELDQALSFNHEALNLDPTSLTALSNLEVLYEAREDWGQVIEILSLSLDLTEGEDHERILFKMGELFRDQLGQPEQAVDSFNALLSLDSTRLDALRAVHELYRGLNDSNSLYNVIQQEIELISGEDVAPSAVEERLSLEIELATLEIDELDKVEDAVSRLSRLIIEHPTHEMTLNLLERIQLMPTYGRSAAELLIEVYRTIGVWDKYVFSLNIIAQDLVDSSERVTLYEEMSRVYLDQLKDDAGAQQALISLVREQPDHPDVIPSLRAVIERTGDWGSFVEVYEEAIREVGELELKVERLLDLANIYEHHLNNLELSIEAYQRVLMEQGDHETALLALERLYNHTEAWRELLDILRVRYEISLSAQAEESLEGSESGEDDPSSTDEARPISHLSEELLSKMGALHEQILDEAHEAIAVHQEMLSYLPSRIGSLRALSRLYERSTQWVELAGVLSQLSKHSELGEEERLNYLKKLGRILYQTLEQLEDALSVFAQILEVSPDDEEVMGSLENLLMTADYRGSSATYLLPYYQRTQQVEREIYCLKVLAEVNANEASLSENPEDLISAQLGFLHKAAKLYSEAGAAQEAYDTYQEALFASPSSDQTIALMTQLVQEAEAWELIIQTYEQLLTQLDDDALLAQRSEELGCLYRDRLQNLEGALSSFERARLALANAETPQATEQEFDEEGEPLEASIQAPRPYPVRRERVLDAIEQLYTQLTLWQELSDLWLERADRAHDYHNVEDEVSYLHQAGALCRDHLYDLARAVEFFTRIILLRPEHAEALTALEAIYREQHAWAEVIDILNRRIELLDEPAEGIALRLEVGQLQERSLGALEVAAESYQHILAIESTNIDALSSLARVLEELSRWDDLIEILDTLSELQSTEARHQSLFKAAQVINREFNDAEACIERLQVILSEAPQFEEALTELERLIDQQRAPVIASELLSKTLRNIGDFGRLVEGWRRLLNVTEARVDQAALWMKIGEVYQEVFIDESSAFEAFAYALRAAPLTPNAYDQMVSIVSRVEHAWPRLAEELELALSEISAVDLAKVGGIEAQTTLHRWAARVYLNHLEDLEQAIQHWESIRELTPDADEALIELERLYEVTQRWEELAEVLRARVNFLDEHASAYRLHAEVPQAQEPAEAAEAHFDETLMGDEGDEGAEPAESAEAHFDETLMGDEGDEGAEPAEAAEAHFDETLMGDEGDEGAEPAEAAAPVEETDDVSHVVPAPLSGDLHSLKLALLHKLANVFSDHLQRADEAIETYQEVFEISPSDETAISQLSALFFTGHAQETISGILEPIYRELNSWRALYDQKQVLVNIRANGPEKRDAFAELADLALNQLNDTQSALMWYGEGFKELPEEDECRSVLHQLALQNGFASALIQLYAEGRERVGDLSRRCDLSILIAKLYIEELQDWENAEHELLYALQVDESRFEAFEALDRVYSTLERWSDLESVIQKELELCSYAEATPERIAYVRNELMWRQADLYEHRLQRPLDAIQTLKIIADDHPDQLEPLSRLETLYRASGYFVELQEIFVAQEQMLEGEQRIDVLRQMARLNADQLASPFEAIELWRSLLEETPEDDEALSALERIYEHVEDWRELIGICELQLSRVEGDPERSLAYHAKLANIWGLRLDRTQNALSAWAQVLALKPDHIDARWSMRDLYRSEGDFSSLLEVNLELLQLLDEAIEGFQLRGEHQAEALHINMAADVIQDVVSAPVVDEPSITSQSAELELYTPPETGDEASEDLGILEQTSTEAIDLNQAATDAISIEDIKADDISVEGFDALASQHSDTSAVYSADLVADLVTEGVADANLSELAELNARRLEVLWDLASLYLEQEDEASAIEALQLRLEKLPTCFESMRLLEDLFQNQGDWEQFAGVVNHRAQYTESPDEKVIALQQLAEVQENYLENLTEAASAYQQVIEVNPYHFDALTHLERLLSSLERWDDVILTLQHRKSIVQDKEDLLHVAKRIAEIHVSQDRAQNALIILGETFVVVPDDAVLGDQIEQLAGETQMWAQAIQLYEGGIQTIGEGSPESIPLRMRVAQWYDDALQQPQHAVTHYQNIQQIDPENVEVLSALENLYEKHAHWGLSAQLIETRLQRITDLDEGAIAWKKLAQIRHEHLEDLDGALIAYQEVLTYNPDDLDALRALKKLYAMKQDFINLIDVLERESRLVEENEIQIENLLRVAEIKEVRLNDVAGAVHAYEMAYEIDPLCVDALMSLELLYRQQKDFVELQRVYEALIVARTHSAEQLSTYGKLARLQLEDLGDRESAIDSYRRMFYIDPQHPEAVTALDRLYREEQRWEELKDTYEQYIDRAPEADHTMVRLVLSDLCEVLYPDSYSSKEKAISYLAPIIERDPTHLETLSRLSVLHGQLGNWSECVRYLSAEVDKLTDRALKIEKMYHLGMAYMDHLEDPEIAIEWMKRALEINPTYSPAMIALKDIYERRGDYQDMIRILTMMEAQASSDIERSKCYFEMGRIYTQLIGDNNTGLDYYSRAIDLDPTNVDVAPFLVEVYLRDERWERAKPLLELLIHHHDQEDLAVRRENHFRLAQCAQKLHQDVAALEHYQHAYRLDSTHLPTLEGLAALYLGQERWEDAANMLQAILIHHGERLNPIEKIDVMLKQGKAKFMVGDDRRTLDLLSRVIEIDASHREAIDLLINTYERREKWEEAIYYRRRRLELSESLDAQFDELIHIGETFRDRLQQPRSAIEAYENALQISEQSRQVFKELLPLYESVSDWQSTIQLLNHFAQLEADGPTKAKYLFAIGALQRDQLNDNIQAVRSFDRALDANPLELKAFSAIEELLAHERNFERQDRYFRKMLKRATEHNMGGDMVFELAKALGEINRSRLGNYSEAIKAYNIALSKRPDDIGTRTVIAELYEREQNWDAAVLQHREILRLDIRQLNSLHKLFQLFVGQGRYDEAWCIAQSLVCLRHAREDEQDFYGQHHSRKLGDIRRHLENDHWSYLIHPKKSPLMDRLFERLYPYNAPAMQQNLKMYGVHKRRDLIVPTEQTPFNSVFEFISRVTRFERLTCFNAPSGASGLRSMNTEPPAVMVGPDMQRSAGMKALAFSIAKLLFLMTPHALIATLDSDYESRRNRLKIIIFTLMRMAGIEVQDFDTGLIDVYRRIDDADLVKINALLNEMQTDQRAHLDVSRWLEGLDHTANRLGFLLCNDLVEATQAIRNESVIISRASVSDRIQELILFSISDEYFALRKALGINIRTS